jgi:hypothetical protein
MYRSVAWLEFERRSALRRAGHTACARELTGSVGEATLEKGAEAIESLRRERELLTDDRPLQLADER